MCQRKSIQATLALVAVAFLWVMPALAADNPPFQLPPFALRAERILPVDMLSAPNYLVSGRVLNDGFINTYTLHTKEGTLTVESTLMLKIRISELNAIRHMEALERTDVFKNALKQGAKAPLRTVKGLVTQPVDTVKGTVSGIGRWFSDVGRSLVSDDPYQENVLKTALGYAAAKRNFAYGYGIDPNTSFEPVQRALSKISQAAFAGGLTPKLAFSAVPKPAGQILKATSSTDGMRRLVRDSSPAQLEKINKEKLSVMGVSKEMTKSFLGNNYYTPQETTLLVGALDSMKGVTGRYVFIASAALADSESVAKFMRFRAEMMVNYTENVAPAESIIQLNGVPCLKKKAGVVVGLLPLDHVVWTPALWKKEAIVLAHLNAMDGITGKELWIEGTVDPTARRALEAHGWKVEEMVGAKLVPKKKEPS